MRFNDEVTVDAPPARVWEVYSDVERWPEWTDSIDSVRYVNGSTIELGATAEIRQPKLPKAVWEVTEVVPGRSWTWVAKGPGVRTVARHFVDPAKGGGGTHVRTEIEQHGPLGKVFGFLTSGMTKRYLAMEGAGLKARSEALGAR